MELKAMVGALAALAQSSRRQLYRLLVQDGPAGAAASEEFHLLCPASALCMSESLAG